MFTSIHLAEVTITTTGSTLLAAEIGVALVVLLLGTLGYLAALWFAAGAHRRRQDRTVEATTEHGHEAPRGITEVWARRNHPVASDRLLDHSLSR